MTPTVVAKDNGVHIVTGPGYMCECGIDEQGNARSCQQILDELVRRGVHDYLDGKVPKESRKPMSTSVRCKVVCTDVKQQTDTSGKVYQESVSFCAVYSEDPASENKWFSQWTPCASFQQTIDNPNAFGTFVKGEEYYVDFTHAPKAAPVELTTDSVPTVSDGEGSAAAQSEASVPAPEEVQPPTDDVPPQAS